MSGSRPMMFPGTEEELAANAASHDWRITGSFQEHPEQTRCESCGCKVGGPTATWPCGTTPPRIEVESGWWR
jgi:hypothetical protein